MIPIKTDLEIKKMRQAGYLAAKTLEAVTSLIRPGVSTGEINKYCHDFIINQGAKPAPLNYQGFPKSICTSINEVVCHGIPSFKRKLKSGDIVNVDVTVIYQGYHGDISKTFLVGQVNQATRLLVERTEKALYKGIEAVKPGEKLSQVGRAIENYIKPFGYGIVKDYGGHGIGKAFHEEPDVFHFYTKENEIELKPGMTFTIEPMINQGGSSKVITDPKDNWTVYTADQGLSAQFEHTLLVTKAGYEILTQIK